VNVCSFIEAGTHSGATRRQRPLSSRLLNTSVIIYLTDEYNEHPGVRKLSLDDTSRDRVINILSLEYKTLRDEIGIRHTARFQLLGLMTAAAALIVTAFVSKSDSIENLWLGIGLASGILLLGLLCFWVLGRQLVGVSARTAQLEEQINALLPSEYSSALRWESDHQTRSPLAMISFGFFPSSSRKHPRANP
jgi:hypothetical protein